MPKKLVARGVSPGETGKDVKERSMASGDKELLGLGTATPMSF